MASCGLSSAFMGTATRSLSSARARRRARKICCSISRSSPPAFPALRSRKLRRGSSRPSPNAYWRSPHGPRTANSAWRCCTGWRNCMPNGRIRTWRGGGASRRPWATMWKRLRTTRSRESWISAFKPATRRRSPRSVPWPVWVNSSEQWDSRGNRSAFRACPPSRARAPQRLTSGAMNWPTRCERHGDSHPVPPCQAVAWPTCSGCGRRCSTMAATTETRSRASCCAMPVGSACTCDAAARPDAGSRPLGCWPIASRATPKAG